MLCVWEFSTVNMIHDDGSVAGRVRCRGAEASRGAVSVVHTGASAKVCLHANGGVG